MELTFFHSVWFFLWGLLWAVYFILSGFDMGVGMLLPFLGKGDVERRMVIQAIGPVWKGNEVWLVTAGGATFAAFPAAYATMFSALYAPLLLILFGLIIRGVAFEFRKHFEEQGLRNVCDLCLAIGSFVPALLLGVAFANLFAGYAIDQEGVLHGNILTLLNPYGIAGGLLFVLAFLVHGALWLAIKSEGVIHQRARSVARFLWPILLVEAVVFLLLSHTHAHLFSKYAANPVLFMVPGIAVLALAAMGAFIYLNRFGSAWLSSALTLAAVTAFGLIGIFPALFPSSLDPAFSVTLMNGSSSVKTLKIMFGVVLVFIPIVIAYQSWAYRLFWGKVTSKDIEY